MEFDSIIEKRHSTRSFKDKKVDWRDALEAIDSATKAPFAGNYNNLKFIIIQDQSIIKRIAERSNQEWIQEANILLVACADYKEMKKLYDDYAEIYARQQAGAAIENLLLKVVDLGLSACWVGAFNEKTLKSILEIPDNITIEAIIPIGYEKKAPKKKKKKELEHSIYWEKWGTKRKPIMFKDPPLHEKPASWT